jgi:DUF4097 and DUF4098 domain-containing protein YvlB
MPTFETPEPIDAVLELVAGEVRITASERTDTVVEVRPVDPSHEPDVTAAAQTRVDYSRGTLVVKAPKSRGYWRRTGSVDVTIELPTTSSVNASAAMLDLRGEGRLGECRVKIAAGQIRLEGTGALHVSTSAGNVTVDHVAGNADVVTGSGDVRIREIDGAAVIKNSNGASWVGEVSGDVRLNAANGGIVVDKALAAVDAKTANGNVRIGEVVRGSIGLQTSMGELEVGVREGTAAWLDVKSTFGTVRSSLTAADSGPAKSEETVEVRARTAFGDILIHRS